MFHRKPRVEDWPDHPLIDRRRHKCPFPAGGSPRSYSDETPWLAIPNWHEDWSPWGVQRYPGKAPKWLAVTTDLWDKAEFQTAGCAERMFLLDLWRHVGVESHHGVVWADPAKMRRQMGYGDAGQFGGLLAYWVKAGWAVYLSDEELAAFEQLCRQVRAGRGKGVGKQPTAPVEPTAERPFVCRHCGVPLKTAAAAKAHLTRKHPQYRGQDTTLHYTTLHNTTEHQTHQITTPARHQSDSEAFGSGQATGHKTDSTPEHITADSTRTGPPPAPSESDNDSLTESDAGQGPGAESPPGAHRASGAPARSARPKAGDPLRLGEITDAMLAWSDVRAVGFGRAVYETIFARKTPDDMRTADLAMRQTVGAFMHLWRDELAGQVNGDAEAFIVYCVEKLHGKNGRKAAYIRRKDNPGGYTMACLRQLAKTWKPP